MTLVTPAGKVRFRRAARADSAALSLLYGQLHAGDEATSPARFAAVLGEVVTSRFFELWVGEAEGRVVATCYLNVIPNLTRGASPYAVIENVVVDRSLRGRGIGKALIEAALARAWSRGCYKAMLQTGSKSEATYAFYRACGFSQTEKVAFVARPPAGQPPA